MASQVDNIENSVHPPKHIRKYNVEHTTPKSQIHAFDVEICENKIRIEVLRMKQCDLIWIGLKNTPTFSNVTLAMQNRYEKVPITTKLYGSNDEALGIAARLSKKLNKQVFLSFNVQSDRIIAIGPLVEKALYTIIENKTDCF